MGALAGWAAAAWMCRPRDQWVGWARAQQWARLRYVANNARFLILPDVRVPNLASKILALNTRRLRADWIAVYGHTVMLAETFVDPDRFTGMSYRAAGWQYLGDTGGFARHHKRYVRHGHPKQLWVRSLGPESPEALRVPFLPAALTEGALAMLDFNALNWTGPHGLRDRLATLTDPRHRRGIRHAIDQVLVLVLAAVLAGQRTILPSVTGFTTSTRKPVVAWGMRLLWMVKAYAAPGTEPGHAQSICYPAWCIGPATC